MIISQGAEAIIERHADKVLKKRLPKTYRLKEIDDSMRKSRTKREIKAMRKAQDLGVRVPKIFDGEDATTICMEYVDGPRLRDVLLEDVTKGSLLVQIGNWLAILHDAEIIHGDLTTSNILVAKGDKLSIIDFGLSFFSARVEDKAVDIHLLEQALESTHYLHKTEFFKQFLEGYAQSAESSLVLERLEEVRKRGRNKH